MSERTVDIDCPRCGATVTCRIYRSDTKLRLIDTSSWRERSEVLMGLDAAMELFGEHSCRPANGGVFEAKA